MTGITLNLRIKLDVVSYEMPSRVQLELCKAQPCKSHCTYGEEASL